MFVLVGIAVSGWQSAPDLLHKINFLVVVFGIPVLSALLALGWRLVKPRVIANTGGRIESVWTDTGPRYGDATVADPDADTPSH